MTSDAPIPEELAGLALKSLFQHPDAEEDLGDVIGAFGHGSAAVLATGLETWKQKGAIEVLDEGTRRARVRFTEKGKWSCQAWWQKPLPVVDIPPPIGSIASTWMSKPPSFAQDAPSQPEEALTEPPPPETTPEAPSGPEEAWLASHTGFATGPIAQIVAETRERDAVLAERLAATCIYDETYAGLTVRQMFLGLAAQIRAQDTDGG
jgi:hypothetical protein